jgi:outer membrane protein OmpA-like peptidoglycan-associated protein
MPGPVTLTVTVEDGRGGRASTTVRLQVTQRVVIEFDPVLFDFDRFNLRPDALEVLEQALATLQANPQIRVTIEGHTDSVGTLEYNLALGERRAQAVFDYLATRGIAAARMQTATFGEERSVAPNTTAEGRQQYRRAQCVIIMD